MDRRLVDREELKANRLAALHDSRLPQRQRNAQRGVIDWEHRRGVCDDVEDLLRREEVFGRELCSGRQFDRRRRLADVITDYIVGSGGGRG